MTRTPTTLMSMRARQVLFEAANLTMPRLPASDQRPEGPLLRDRTGQAHLAGIPASSGERPCPRKSI